MNERMLRRDDILSRGKESNDDDDDNDDDEHPYFIGRFIIRAKTYIRLSWILDYHVCSGY